MKKRRNMKNTKYGRTQHRSITGYVQNKQNEYYHGTVSIAPVLIAQSVKRLLYEQRDPCIGVPFPAGARDGSLI
jgi:hypothetical protein